MVDLISRLPKVTGAKGKYEPFIRRGPHLHVFGQLPREDGELKPIGKVGDQISIEEAQHAAQLCALHALAVMQNALGSFDAIEQLGHLNVYVASALGFGKHPAVADSASLVFYEVLGARGGHTRTAIGVYELPYGAPVEIDLCAFVKA